MQKIGRVRSKSNKIIELCVAFSFVASCDFLFCERCGEDGKNIRLA